MKRLYIDAPALSNNMPPPSETFSDDIMAKLNMMATKEEKPMKRKLSTTLLIAALLIMLLVATAVAIGIRRSVEVDIVIQARQALFNDYGLTMETIGCFHYRTVQEGDQWTITFKGAAWELSRLGYYTVHLAPGEPPRTEWSHDDVDPAIWQDGDLSAPVWGQKQILKRLQMTQEEGDAFTLANLSLETENIEEDPEVAISTADKYLEFVRCARDAEDISEEEALRLAMNVIHDTYAIKKETLEQAMTKLTLVKPQGGGEKQYIVEVRLRTTGQGFVFLFISASTGETLSLWWEVDGEKRTLPDGTLSAYPQAVKEFLGTDKVMMSRTAAEKLDILKRMKAEGLEDWIVSVHSDVLPDPSIDDIALINEANQALKLAYGINKEVLALFNTSIAIVEDGGRCFVIDYYPSVPQAGWGWVWDHFVSPGIGTYTVFIRPDTDEALEIIWSQVGEWADEAYTKETWGTAPAYHGKLLPWAIALQKGINAIASKYSPDTTIYEYSFEDYALFDTLFREAGFSSNQFSRALPKDDELSYEEALRIAKDAILAEMPDAQTALEDAHISGEYAVRDSDAPVWRFSFFFTVKDVLIDFGVALDAKTGEVILTNVITGGNG